MYSPQDLDEGVKEGIFQPEQVSNFKELMSSKKALCSPSMEVERFKLFTGFTDIFIVIACFLLVISIYQILLIFNPIVSAFGAAAVSWALSEYFILKKKMSMPAIFLLLSFIGSLCIGLVSYNKNLFVPALTFGAVAGFVHYIRFKVPFSIAAITGCILVIVNSVIMGVFKDNSLVFTISLFLSGLVTLCIAIYWDKKDPQRTGTASDTAFWLHLLAAPLLVHSIFSSAYSGDIGGVLLPILILLLYVLITLLSLFLDRKALMVSALAYVLFAFSKVLEQSGLLEMNMALAGLIIGGGLLFLSIYWERARRALLKTVKYRNQ